MTVAARAARSTAWSRPAFRFLLGAEAVTLSGSAVSTIALPALAVLELRASTTEVAVLAFLGQLPNAVALWAGALSDRHPKRPQLIASDLAAGAALVTIPAAALVGVLTVGQLCAVAVVLGAAKVVHDAAAISLLPAVVGPDQLHDANSKIGAASSVADSAGTNVGALLVGAIGPARSVLVDAVSFLVAAVLIWRMRIPEAATAPRARTGLTRDIAAGVRYVARQPTIRTVIAALSTLSFGLAIMNTYWAYYLLDRLGASPSAFGVIMGVGGAGGVVGALLAPWIAARIGIGPTIVVGFAVSPVAQVPLLCAGPGLRWQIVLAATLAVQLFWATASGTSQRSLRQSVCHPAFQGRMQSASTTLTAGTRPLAAVTAGGLVLLLDVRATLAVGALLQVVPVVLLLASPIRTLRKIPRAAVPPAREGAPS
ncbi:MFS transporter [Streptomyces sp. SP18BB07]|uniref:MFS transporter n=1 Tax=Streptomyces sp. SP18BB07 TaxID=3002522 RepID=UPI002E76A92A|nr:MFS transporter [Streptomyces sp. SP18BB07]MEE1761319.1 MFS transporter [Streptomyces sp. SP18BB07]